MTNQQQINQAQQAGAAGNNVSTNGMSYADKQRIDAAYAQGKKG